MFDSQKKENLKKNYFFKLVNISSNNHLLSIKLKCKILNFAAKRKCKKAFKKCKKISIFYISISITDIIQLTSLLQFSRKNK